MSIESKKYFLIVFLVSFIYAIIGLYGLAMYQSKDLDSYKEFMTVSLEIILSILSFCMAGFVFFLLRKMKLKSKPGLPQTKSFKIFMMTIVLLFSSVLFLASNVGYLLLINSTCGQQESIFINGKIVNKYFEIGSKDSKTYFINVKDFSTEKVFHLIVDKNLYRYNDKDSIFNYEFKKGCFGIIYRK